MRRILLIAILLGITTSAGAQAPNTNPMGIISFSGRYSERQGSVNHLTGGVRFRIGAALVTADEAIVDWEKNEVEFRGNVTMKAATK